MNTVAEWAPSVALDSLAAVSGAPRPQLSRQEAHSQGAEVVPLNPRKLPAPSPEPEVPGELEAVARRAARGALEVLGGTRPLQQMARLLDPRSYERLQLRANLVRSVEQSTERNRRTSPTAASGRLHRNVLIRTVRICAITDTIFEASVVAAEQKRARAIALRIERWRGQWRVTELQIG